MNVVSWGPLGTRLPVQLTLYRTTGDSEVEVLRMKLKLSLREELSTVSVQVVQIEAPCQHEGLCQFPRQQIELLKPASDVVHLRLITS